MARFAWIGLLVSLGCTGSIGDTNPQTDPIYTPGGRFEIPEGFCDDDPPELSNLPLRRLSPVEFQNTVNDLLGNTPYEAPNFPHQTTEHGFENFTANTNEVPTLFVEGYANTAFRASKAAVGDDNRMRDILGCATWDSAAEQSDCTNSFLDGFALRAFRRPLTEQERATYMAMISEQTSEIDYPAAIELATAALMQSPNFTYRVEQIGDEATPYEIASRLSYLLWQSMPDEALFAAAAADELDQEGVEAQARRMMESPRATKALSDFHRQWLLLGQMYEDKHQRKDPTTFPEWNETLQDTMAEESERFIEHVMSSEESATLGELLNNRTAFVKSPLAEHYNVPAASDWTEVQLPESERAGILTRGAFLSGQGLVGWGSPIYRGKFIIESMLCENLGAPPADAPTQLAEPDPNDPQTNRTRYKNATAAPECQTCHSRINPIGFTFENYTSTGGFREFDNGEAVDATGSLTGADNAGPVQNAIEMSQKLGQSQDVANCAAEKWVSYALGRRLDDADLCVLDTARKSMAASGGNIRQLLMDIVTHPEFTRGAK